MKTGEIRRTQNKMPKKDFSFFSCDVKRGVNDVTWDIEGHGFHGE